MTLHLVGDVVPPDIAHHLGSTGIEVVPSILIGGATVLYLWGVVRVNGGDPGQRWSVKRTCSFLAAMALVFVAVELVVGVYDDTLFYDHMIQHLILLMVAAPLIAMAAPLELLARATTGSAHRYVTQILDSPVARIVGHPITGFALYAVLIPAVHLTSLYNTMLTNDVAHDNEHLVFLFVGYLFWRPVVAIEPTRHPLTPTLRLVYLLLALPIDTFSGLVLVSANHELFSTYLTVGRPWGPSLVGDLHIGGTIMWSAGDGLVLLAIAVVIVSWMREANDDPARRSADPGTRYTQVSSDTR